MSTNKSNKNDSRISVQETTWLDISVPPSMVPEFKQMVIRATNTWQDMSLEMRMFMDRVLGQEDIMKVTYAGKVSKKNKIVVEDVQIQSSSSLCTECYQIPCICEVKSVHCSKCGEAAHMHPYRNCDEFIA